MTDARKTRRTSANEDSADPFDVELGRAAAEAREETHRHPLTVFYAPEYWAEAPDFDTFRKSYWIERHLRAPGGERDFVRLEAPGCAGTRIPVELLLRKLSEGASEADLLQAYPRLTREDLQAAMRYAADTVAHEEIVFLDRERSA